MTEVGAIIETGHAIPDDVTEVEDCDADRWNLTEEGWDLAGSPDTYRGKTSKWLAQYYGRLTVTAVRGELERVPYIGERTSTGSVEDFPPEPEPSVLLDLVRQYGEASQTLALNGGQTERAAEYHGAQVRALFDRIAALVPQQSAQALLVELLDITGVDKAIHLAAAVQNLVTAYKTAQQPEAPDFLAAVNKLTIERDDWKHRFHEQADRGDADAEKRLSLMRELNEARAEVERLRAAADTEFREWSERQLMDALGVGQLPDVIPAIERLMAAHHDPSVLSLPTVPDGAVRLIASNGVRWLPGEDRVWRREDMPGVEFYLGQLLDSVAFVTVVMREPRTWPKTENENSDLPNAVSVERHGIWRRLALPDDRLYVQAEPFGAIKVTLRLPLSGLQLLGEVTEVFEDQAGGAG